MESSRGRSPWAFTAAVLIAIFVFGAVLIVLGIARSPAPADEFWTDVAKAGLQIAGVTVIGAVVSIMLKNLDERRRLDERRLQVFRDIIAAYHRVKGARRNLRALGLLTPTKPLSAEQARGLREQMAILNDAQLSLEAVQRELKESGLFRDQGAMWRQLRIAEHYLGECVHGPWEIGGGSIWEGTSVNAVKNLRLVEFAGHKHEGHRAFEENVSTPLDMLTKLLHEELFGEPEVADPVDPAKPC